MAEKEQVESLEDVPERTPTEMMAVMRWTRPVIAVLAINAITLAQILAVLGSGILAQQTTIYLGDVSKAGWLSAVLTLFTLALNPLLGQAADYWGRRWIILTTSLGGVVGPLIIARSSHVGMLIAGFSILGIAFGCQSAFYTIVSEVLPRQHRSIGQATLSVTSGVGGLVGILTAGTLLKNNNFGNYRIFWYIVAGLYFLGIIGVLLGYRPPLRNLERRLSTRQKLASMDWVGGALLTGGLVALSIALQYSENPYHWSNAHVNAPFIVGVILLIFFAVYEWRFRTDGIINHRLFGDRNFAIAQTTIFIEGLAYFAANSYFTLEVQLFTQTDLFWAGMRFSILFFAAATSSVAVGLYTTWTKRVRGPIIFGYCCLVVFQALMASVTTSTSTTVFWGYPVFAGMAIGCLLPNLTVITQMSAPKETISITTGLLITTRSLGACTGLAVNNAIFNKALSSNLGPKIAAAVIPLGFNASDLGILIQALSSGDSAAIAAVPNATPTIIVAAGHASQEAYAIAFRNIWICSAAFSVAGLAVAAFLKSVRAEFTSEVDAPVVEEKSAFDD